MAPPDGPGSNPLGSPEAGLERPDSKPRSKEKKGSPEGLYIGSAVKEAQAVEAEKEQLMSEMVADLVVELGLEEDELKRHEIIQKRLDVTKSPRRFGKLYKRVKEKYEEKAGEDVEFKGKYPTFEKYFETEGREVLQDKAMEDERNQRRAVLRIRLRNLQEPEVDEGTEMEDIEIDEEVVEEQARAIENFGEINRESLGQYYDLADPEQDMLIAKFVALEPIQNLSKGEREDLFFQLVEDVLQAQEAQNRFGAGYEAMIKFAKRADEQGWDLDNLTDEQVAEWEKEVEKAIEESGKEKLKEENEKLGITIPIYRGEDVEIRDYDTPYAVAHDAGLNIVGMSEDGTYYVSYPGTTYVTQMRIVKDESSSNYNGSKIVFYDEYADPTKSKYSECICNRQNLRREANRILLDYLLNVRVRRQPGGSADNINRYFADDAMMRMAGAVLKREDLGEIVVAADPNRIKLVEKLFNIALLKDNDSEKYGKLGSFQNRVKVMKRVLSNPNSNYAARAREFLQSDGTVLPLSGFLEVIGYEPGDIQ